LAVGRLGSNFACWDYRKISLSAFVSREAGVRVVSREKSRFKACNKAGERESHQQRGAEKDISTAVVFTLNGEDGACVRVGRLKYA